jgi:hypothetical protein
MAAPFLPWCEFCGMHGHRPFRNNRWWRRLLRRL